MEKKNLFRTAYLTSFSLIDIKPQNLLLSNENIVKLIDFGNATIVTDSLAGYNTGTPAFMAPELLKKGTYYAPLPSTNIVSKKNVISSTQWIPYVCRSMVNGCHSILFYLWPSTF